jgi:hypothetical protein
VPPESLDFFSIRDALALLGNSNRLRSETEITIVGGAAGVLTGLLPALWATSDVDSIAFQLPESRDDVLEAAAEVARSHQLPADWLNDWSGLFAWTLPDGWEDRRVHVGEFGRLRVYAVGRLDLITMKFLAHRQRDIEHLDKLNVTSRDIEQVSSNLQLLQGQYPLGQFPSEAGKIAMAQQYLRAWGTK